MANRANTSFNSGRFGKDLRKPGGEVPPIYLADRRLIVGPRVGTITVDYAQHRLSKAPFDLLYHLGEQADEAVSYEQIAKEVYGYGELSEQTVQSLKATIRNQISEIRIALGVEDLGDDKYGAIRNAFSIGYVAVTNLE